MAAAWSRDPVRARYEIRKDNEKGMVCVDDDALPGVEKAGECKSDAVGLMRDRQPVPCLQRRN